MYDQRAIQPSRGTGCMVFLAMVCGVALAALAPWLVARTGLATLGTAVRGLGIAAAIVMFIGIPAAMMLAIPLLKHRLGQATAHGGMRMPRKTFFGSIIGTVIAFTLTATLSGIGALAIVGIFSIALYR